jgi:peptide methionine sulfoxide reductase msrA/msrB
MDKTSTLTPNILNIIKHKGTEAPNSGKLNLFEGKGTYLCRTCGVALFRSTHKFISACGWPSFDDELPGVIKRVPDIDGRRTEILCERCDAHLGHVFHNEGLTKKNMRHCVNSESIDFVDDQEVLDTEDAFYAGGCFWGMQYYFAKFDGVLATEVGYMGGGLQSPVYEKVCLGGTGHREVIRVLFNPAKISFKHLTQYFFEIHDPTQAGGQGPDIGEQYESVIYVMTPEQNSIALSLIDQLNCMEFPVKTSVLPAKTFWMAELDHQHYYKAKGTLPYCHHWQKRF